jgi:hypothetical protein
MAIRTESIRMDSQRRALESSEQGSIDLPEIRSDARDAAESKDTASGAGESRPASKEYFFIDQSEMKTIQKGEQGQASPQSQTSTDGGEIPETSSEDTFFVIDTPQE